MLLASPNSQTFEAERANHRSESIDVAALRALGVNIADAHEQPSIARRGSAMSIDAQGRPEYASVEWSDPADGASSARRGQCLLELSTSRSIEQERDPACAPLSEAHIRQLARALRACQAHAGRPQRIEWALDRDGALWLLEIAPLERVAVRSDLGEFTTANFRDGGVSAAVCAPLMYSFYERAMQHSLGRYLTHVKLLSAQQPMPAWVTYQYGRVYWNAGAVKEALKAIPGFDERRFDEDLGIHQEYGGAGPARTPFTARTVLRALPCAWALHEEYARHLERCAEFIPRFEATRASLLERAAGAQLLDDSDFLRDCWRVLFDVHFEAECMYFRTVYNASNAQTDLRRLLDRIDPLLDAPADLVSLVAGLGDVQHLELQRDLAELVALAARIGLSDRGSSDPRWLRARDAFLRSHGYRSDAELDLAAPRWCEQPEQVRAWVEGILRAGTAPVDPDARIAEQSRRAQREIQRISARLAQRRVWALRYGRSFRARLSRLRSYLSLRERMKRCSAQCYELVRRYLLELGRRLVRRGDLERWEDVLLLELAELRQLAEQGRWPGFDELLAYRRDLHAGYRAFTPPAELGARTRRAPAAAAPTADGTRVLEGLGCSPGTVDGFARIVCKPSELGSIRPGDVVVTRFGDPSWTMALGVAGGLITEAGGQLSHIAVISREFGIPAVLGVATATTLIRDGELLRVDGTRGRVERLELVSNDAVRA